MKLFASTSIVLFLAISPVLAISLIGGNLCIARLAGCLLGLADLAVIVVAILVIDDYLGEVRPRAVLTRIKELLRGLGLFSSDQGL